MVKAKFLDQAVAALLHSALDDSVDLRICDALSNGLIALELTQIGCSGMAGIEGKELALDVGFKIVDRRHTFNLGYSTYKRSTLHIPLKVLLDGDIQRHFAVDGGNDTVDSGIRKSDMRLSPLCGLGIYMREHQLLELAGGTKAIFTGNNLQGSLVAGFLACLEALGYGRSDKLENAQADSRGNNFCIRDLLNDIVASGVDSADIADLHITLVDIGDMYCVPLAGIDLLDKILYDVSKHDFVARLAEYRTDKTAADITSAKLNRFFHGLYFRMLFVSI